MFYDILYYIRKIYAIIIIYIKYKVDITSCHRSLPGTLEWAAANAKLKQVEEHSKKITISTG